MVSTAAASVLPALRAPLLVRSREWVHAWLLLLPAVAAVVQYTVTTSKVRVPRR
jgi:hypothetical protein